MRYTGLFLLLAFMVFLPIGKAQDATSDGVSVERAVAHYAKVERELLAADTAHLTPTQQEARARLIRELRAYRESRNFTVNTGYPGARVPYFTDQQGRRCAVAHLLHRFGEDALVGEVTAADNHAYVSDLADHPGLVAWLDEVGLSPWEAARIQVPGTVPPAEERRGEPTNPPESPPTTTPELEDEPGPSSPPATPPSDESSGPTTAPGSPRGPSTARPSPNGSGPGRLRGGGRPAGRAASPGHGVGSWWLWWELNKLDYLVANPLRFETGAVTGRVTPEGSIEIQKRRIEKHRLQAMPELLAALKDKNALVRAAAVVAVGRVGSDSAMSSLLTMLDDPQQYVRERAILALGATGSEQAGQTLLSIARTGSHRPRSDSKIVPDARPLAIIALGLLRRYGVEKSYDAALAELAATCKKRDLEEIGGSMLLHGILAPGPRVKAKTENLARDRNAPDPVRARALEQLAVLEDAKALRTLQQALAGSRLALRRSAALALREVEHDLVLPRLMTAYELEKEPLTRGFLLLSIAGHGGEKAVRFIAKELADGPKTLRPWAALALGLAAREGDHLARAALVGVELPGADQGAIWIARGLAADSDAIPALRAALEKTGSPRARSHAATALALIGGERSRHALLSRIGVEYSAPVRVWIAQCIGLLGRDEDSDVLIGALMESRRPEHTGVLAVGLAYHGSAATLKGLTELLGAGEVHPVARATAVTAIGLLLDRRPGLEFPALSRRTNYASAPAWLFPVLLSTL